MVIGYAADPMTYNSDFSIVLLSALGPGQSISATDAGWRTDVAPNMLDLRNPSDDYIVTHTASADEPAGTVLTASDFSAPLLLDPLDGDQLIVYQGSKDSPTFVCAFDNSKNFFHSAW